MRSSRSDWEACLTATASAFSHDSGLAPTSSMTLYTLSDMIRSLLGSRMKIRDRLDGARPGSFRRHRPRSCRLVTWRPGRHRGGGSKPHRTSPQVPAPEAGSLAARWVAQCFPLFAATPSHRLVL